MVTKNKFSKLKLQKLKGPKHIIESKSYAAKVKKPKKQFAA